MKKIFLLLISSLMFLAPAQAEVRSNIPNVLVSSSIARVSGARLSSHTNPFTAVAVNLDGSSVALPSDVSREGDRAKFQLPTVTSDTKIILKLSGGDVSNGSAQEYVILLLAKPDGFNGDDAAIAEDVNLPSGSGSTEGPQGPAGPTGPQGPEGAKGAQGIPGPQGAQGPQGPLAISGGNLDVDSLPSSDISTPTLVTNPLGGIDLQGATYFAAQDSNTSTTNRIISLSGATVPGQKLTITFQARVDVADANPFTSRLKPRDPEISGGNIYLVDKLLGRSNLQSFQPGDTLELVYGSDAFWYEVSRSSTTVSSSR